MQQALNQNLCSSQINVENVNVIALGKTKRGNASRWVENLVVDGALRRKECFCINNALFVQRQMVEMTMSGAIEEFVKATFTDSVDELTILEDSSIAVKSFNVGEDNESEAALRELAIQQQLSQRCEYILPVLDIARTKNRIFAFVPFAKNGDLFQAIKNQHQRRLFSPASMICKDIIKKMLIAVAACHENGIAHRDISPENFLLKDSVTPVLIDFGLSTKMEEDWSCVATRVGKEFYMAPEVYEQKDAYYDGRKMDIWSLAVTFFIMTSPDASPPWHVASPDDKFFSNAMRDMRTFLFKHYPRFSVFRHFIEQMLQPDPVLRPTAQKLLEHEWLTGGDEGCLIGVGCT